ncbi:hypothetical protein Poli38472_000162 [Pythium oligandrum]|uniref:EF-hand domain-containing protein n=1 Tax=Pythium oligandrum TaxID=41045 RepID=A0A8K1FE41_PYTOL|nr:hypothetical protein Poli38472_000162 [Pythium oligandrum]|eukprot:TMW60120.1 hypothetical protein Poli38472_000162 [Pythium oligandrum]
MTTLSMLQELFETAPDVERLSLRGYQLTTLDAELDYIRSHFTHVRHLDLSQNQLQELPVAFSSYLPRLVALDLTENRFRSIPELSEVLATCHSLKSLSVSFRNKTDEKVIRVMLPKLRILNGTPLQQDEPDDELQRPKKPKESSQGRSELVLDLPSPSPASESGLWLDTPSPIASSCQSPQEKRDLLVKFAQVKATNTEKPKSSQMTRKEPRKWQSVRPTEQPATISDDRTDWRKLLKKNESSTVAVNPVQSTKSTSSSFVTELRSILKAFQLVSDPKRTGRGAAVAAETRAMIEQLERHVDELIQQLQAMEQTHEGAEKTVKQEIEVLTARWRVLEVSNLYGIEKTSTVDPALGSGLEHLINAQRRVVDALLKRVTEVLEAQQKWQEASTSQEQVTEQQKRQMKVLLDVAETLEKDLEALQARYQQERTTREAVEQENQALKQQCESLKQQQAKTTITKTGPKTIATSTTQRRIRRRSGEEGTGGADPGPETRKSPPRAVPTESISSSAVPTQPVAVRTLTLKQLVDLIHCIFTSKAKSDARLHTIRAPSETMEQHMYTYLTQRFGLPALTIEYASAIWKGCQMHTREENDVALFHALLRNQVDEDFIGIKKKLHHALRDLLRAYFLAKFPMKQETAIVKLVESRLQGVIYEEEWTEVLLYLYDPHDSSVLLRLVQRKADSSSSTVATATSRSTTTAKVQKSLPFTVLEKLLFDYQLQGRLKLLDGFCQLFARFDKDNVGILSRERFCALVQQLAPRRSPQEIEKMLDRMDPFEHDTVTFSDVQECTYGGF